MSATPDGKLSRAQAWDRFWDIAAEIAVRQMQRDATFGRLLDQGHSQEDFDEVDRAVREVDRAMRWLRRAMKELPALPSEAGCATEVDELRRQLGRLSASWRDTKSSWCEHDPRPGVDR